MSEQAASRVTVGAAPKDFDAERLAGVNRRVLTFKAGGEEFRVKPFVTPEQMEAFRDAAPPKLEGNEEKPGELTGAPIYDTYVLNMLVEEDQPKWLKIRKEADPPLSLADIEAICYWLIEVATGRPTERPSSSGRGPAASGATSKGRSALQTT